MTTVSAPATPSHLRPPSPVPATPPHVSPSFPQFHGGPCARHAGFAHAEPRDVTEPPCGTSRAHARVRSAGQRSVPGRTASPRPLAEPPPHPADRPRFAPRKAATDIRVKAFGETSTCPGSGLRGHWPFHVSTDCDRGRRWPSRSAAPDRHAATSSPAVPCHFPSAWRTFTLLAYRGSWLVINSSSLCGLKSILSLVFEKFFSLCMKF